MQYVRATPNTSGAYPAPQSNFFPGCLPLADSQVELLVQYNGFVTIIREPDEDVPGSSVTVEPNIEAWEAWKASHPTEHKEPEPTQTMDERVTALKGNTAELQEALDMILTGVTE